MAKITFAKAMPHAFLEEDGYVDDPKDAGGATNLGITLATLSTWEGRKVSKAEVKALMKAKATDIYKANYWNKVSGDDMPAGVDYAISDFCINSGPARAVKMLQKVIGILDYRGRIHTYRTTKKRQRAALEVAEATAKVIQKKEKIDGRIRNMGVQGLCIELGGEVQCDAIELRGVENNPD